MGRKGDQIGFILLYEVAGRGRDDMDAVADLVCQRLVRVTQLLPFFRDVHDHLLRISDLAEGYRDLVSSLFDIHFAVVGNRTNDVMKTLAVLSAIILPLSLIAGIYGMNFKHIPELETENGYWFTLGAMGLITILLLIYFWRRGWIFQRESVLEIEQSKEVIDDYEEA